MFPWHTLKAIWRHPANADRRVRALARYGWWQVAKRTSPGFHDLPYHGLRLRCYPDSHSASAAVYFGGLQDYAEMRFMQRYLRAGDCFVDVGANIGVYSLLAASLVGTSGCVHAFEPSPATFRRLRENIAINGLDYVRCHPLALLDSPGSRSLRQLDDDCLAALEPTHATPPGSVEVGCTTLDETLVGIDIGMLKLDVEGAEPLVLRGAREHLRTGNPPVIQVEMDGYNAYYGVSTDELISEIHDYGYLIAIYQPDANHLMETTRPWEHAQNVLAIHRRRADEVRARISEPRPGVL